MRPSSLIDSFSRLATARHFVRHIGPRIRLILGLLACFAVPALAAPAAASDSAISGGLTVRRSMRAAPHRLLVHPSGATVTADQTQRFEVTDAQGNPVAVHWNVSGIGCSGASCGSIDDQGIYHPPASLPQPGIVTIEGVLESDPNYSVLTDVRLAPASSASTSNSNSNLLSSSSPAPVASDSSARPVAKTQPLSAPSIERRPVSPRVELPSLPKAIAAAPDLATQNLGRHRIVRPGGLPPLPNAVAAAPIVGTLNVAHSAALPPLPNAVAAAPQLDNKRFDNQRFDNKNDKNSSQRPQPSAGLPAAMPPLPGVVPAAPQFESLNLPRRAELPLPLVVRAAPSVANQRLARTDDISPLPNVVPAAPASENQKSENQTTAHKAELPLPNPAAAPAPSAATDPPQTVPAALAQSRQLPSPSPAIASTTAVAKPKHAKNEELSALQLEVGAAPGVGRQDLSRFTNLPAVPRAVSSAPDPGDSHFARRPNPSSVPQLVASASPAAAQVPPVIPPVILHHDREDARRNPPPKAVLPQMQDALSGAPNSGSGPARNTSAVSYSNGQLRIDAENLSLAAVLKLVAEKTGAAIEVPAGSGTDPIFEHIGPGRPEDVLAALLNGSPFDYVIVGSPERPHEPAQVLLSLRGITPVVTAPTQVAETTPQPSPSSYLFTPSSQPRPVNPSPIFTSPGAASAAVAAAPVVAQPPAGTTPAEPLSPDAREQMMRAYTRQLHGQSSQ